MEPSQHLQDTIELALEQIIKTATREMQAILLVTSAAIQTAITDEALKHDELRKKVPGAAQSPVAGAQAEVPQGEAMRSL